MSSQWSVGFICRRAFLEDVEVYAILSDDSIIHQPVTVTIYDVMNAHNFNCTTGNIIVI